MATLFKSGQKLYAKRDGINVYDIPRTGANRWLYRPQRDEPDGPTREYQLYDEIGIFHQEIDGEDGKYLKVEAWTNGEGFFGDNYTIGHFVYLRPSDDNALTLDQVNDARQLKQNQETIEDLKTKVYPEWKTQGINLPTDVFYDKNKDGHSTLYLKFANGNVVEYDKFSGLSLLAKRTASGVTPTEDNGTGNGSGNGNGNGNGNGTGNSFGLYGVLAGIGLVVLVIAYLFIKKRRGS